MPTIFVETNFDFLSKDCLKFTKKFNKILKTLSKTKQNCLYIFQLNFHNVVKSQNKKTTPSALFIFLFLQNVLMMSVLQVFHLATFVGSAKILVLVLCNEKALHLHNLVASNMAK